MNEIMNFNDSKRIYPQVNASTHTFYLYEVGDPEDYIEWYEAMRKAGPHDTIYIHINSIGGRMSTAQQMLRCMNECQGTIIASVEGECASAATLIFLAADGWEVSPHSIFMFHNYSGGVFGKGGEMYDRIEFEKKWAEALMREAYTDFLTEEEMTEMFLGKDQYFTSDEVMEKLNHRLDKREKEKYKLEIAATPLEVFEEELKALKEDIAYKKKLEKQSNEK